LVVNGPRLAPHRSSVSRSPNGVGFGARLLGRRHQPPNDFEPVIEISLPLLRRRQAVRKSAEDRKEDRAGHPSAKGKNCATRR